MGIFGGILDSFTGGLGSSLLGLGSAQVSNAQSAKAAQKANQFSAAESLKSRNFNAEQSNISRDFNAGQAQIDRDYQERMSNTSYQRAVGDLGRAGLNPMLSVMHQGASTPSGASASSSPASSNPARGAMAQTFGAAPNNAMNTKAIEEANSRIGLNNAAAAKNNAEAASLPGYRQAQVGLAGAQENQAQTSASKQYQEIKNLQQEVILKQAEVLKTLSGNALDNANASLARAREALTGNEANALDARAALNRVEANLAPIYARTNQIEGQVKQGHIAESQENSKYYNEHPWAKAAEKWLGMGSSFLSGAKDAATTAAGVTYANRRRRP